MTDTFRLEQKPLDDAAKELIKTIKVNAAQLEGVINCMANSREKSLAITNLEQCVMWAVKSATRLTGEEVLNKICGA